MNDQFPEQLVPASNLVLFPSRLPLGERIPQPEVKKPTVPSPVSDKLVEEGRKLDRMSKYPSTFDYGCYRDLEIRFSKQPIRGGIVFRSPVKLVNSHSTCQQCLYTFELDTYGRGCSFNCAYCYAKAELTVHGYWNNPIPVPVDINEIRKLFYTVFETNRKTKWRSIMEQRIPIRIGSMTDSFMFADKKYRVTQEVLKILNFYKYPHIIFTRSDLVASDEYLNLLDPKLVSVQMSMSSINDGLNKLVEPGAPSSKRRLEALQKVSEAGFWTTVRINPLFPMYPDGYFTDPTFKKSEETPKFEFSSFDMVDAIAAHKIPSFLVGFGRFSPFALRGIMKTTGIDLRPFFKKELITGARGDYRFSDQEIRHYYAEFKRRAVARNVQFTTCYIGNGEGHFWKDQDLWSNKKDCCNIQGRLKAFKADTRQIPFDERLKFTIHKGSVPSSERLHEPLGKAEIKVVSSETNRSMDGEAPQ